MITIDGRGGEPLLEQSDYLTINGNKGSLVSILATDNTADFVSDLKAYEVQEQFIKILGNRGFTNDPPSFKAAWTSNKLSTPAYGVLFNEVIHFGSAVIIPENVEKFTVEAEIALIAKDDFQLDDFETLSSKDKFELFVPHLAFEVIDHSDLPTKKSRFSTIASNVRSSFLLVGSQVLSESISALETIVTEGSLKLNGGNAKTPSPLHQGLEAQLTNTILHIRDFRKFKFLKRGSLLSCGAHTSHTISITDSGSSVISFSVPGVDDELTLKIKSR